MKHVLLFLVLFLLILGGWFLFAQHANAPESEQVVPEIPKPLATTTQTIMPTTAQENSYKDLVRISSPKLDEKIASPLFVKGEARGFWFFEGSFPVTLTNWDGLIIAEGIAQAQGDWMTEEYVPFAVTLTFDSPYTFTDQPFMERGSLILKKDNPSGLPENDDAFEVTVRFEQTD